MTIKLTPYGLGRDWMAYKGPHAGKLCMEVIDAYDWDQDSAEADQFTNGADSYADEFGRFGNADA